jgi:hypothetical protein
LKELQQLLGKFLWAAPFIPHFKQLVEPIEKLLSPKNEGIWTPECTQAVNRLVQVMFAQVQLHQADPYGVISMHPTTAGHLGFVTLT